MRFVKNYVVTVILLDANVTYSAVDLHSVLYGLIANIKVTSFQCEDSAMGPGFLYKNVLGADAER